MPSTPKNLKKKKESTHSSGTKTVSSSYLSLTVIRSGFTRIRSTSAANLHQSPSPTNASSVLCLLSSTYVQQAHELCWINPTWCFKLTIIQTPWPNTDPLTSFLIRMVYFSLSHITRHNARWMEGITFPNKTSKSCWVGRLIYWIIEASTTSIRRF